jgi:hypothetical protein
MNKTTETKLSKQILQGSLFVNGMLLNNDEMCKRVPGY